MGLRKDITEAGMQVVHWCQDHNTVLAYNREGYPVRFDRDGCDIRARQATLGETVEYPTEYYVCEMTPYDSLTGEREWFWQPYSKALATG